ncbi:MAG TPA: ABC transporter substrate-binding protein, partial [Reyranella sp.]
MAFMINRRTALAGAAALAASSAAFPAAAEDKKVIIGTWGGDYSRLLTKNIDSLLKGTECVHAEENADPRKAKMMAEKVLRRGTVDVQGLSANDMFDMDQQGLAEHL